MTATAVPVAVVTGVLAVLLALFLRWAQHTTIIQMMTHGRPHRNTVAITTPTMIPVKLAVAWELVEIVTDSVESVPV